MGFGTYSAPGICRNGHNLRESIVLSGPGASGRREATAARRSRPGCPEVPSPSVLGRAVDVVDHEHLHLCLARHQFQRRDRFGRGRWCLVPFARRIAIERGSLELRPELPIGSDEHEVITWHFTRFVMRRHISCDRLTTCATSIRDVISVGSVPSSWPSAVPHRPDHENRGEQQHERRQIDARQVGRHDGEYRAGTQNRQVSPRRSWQARTQPMNDVVQRRTRAG